jgi:hypothetical protein
VVKKQVFDALPPYVFFHLKRFDYDPYNETRFKLDTPLSFSTTLSFLASSYELQGVITHEGTATSGHYRCFLFNHGQWTETSDLKVAHHAFNDPSVDWVRRDGGEGVERLVSGREVIHRSMSSHHLIHRSTNPQESRPMTRQSSNDRSTTSNRSTSTTSNPLKPTPYILLYRRRRSDNAPSSLRILTSEAFWVLLETLLDRPDDPIMPLLGRIRTYGPLSPP